MYEEQLLFYPNNILFSLSIRNICIDSDCLFNHIKGLSKMLVPPKLKQRVLNTWSTLSSYFYLGYYNFEIGLIKRLFKILERKVMILWWFLLWWFQSQDLRDIKLFFNLCIQAEARLKLHLAYWFLLHKIIKIKSEKTVFRVPWLKARQKKRKTADSENGGI